MLKPKIENNMKSTRRAIFYLDNVKEQNDFDITNRKSTKNIRLKQKNINVLIACQHLSELY